ncbi:IclR family transcriptional regulator [Acidaminobacter sp. JC074]|uniref:IclR family transcriptional regulator n=1 Tax=Acidaminobacter sp. JC074 TaxID=2530199 RepID=UPI001F10FB58|nr:IclR family transcriptional regulator [Acidaminobacter sp. JC074]MCH4886986.1 IclR family transcriptional regulator [Acidaminobacter sp. JC074]
MKQEVVQSVDRALSILEAIGEGKNNLLEISKYLGLNKSTVHRLLHTLIYKGYVVQKDDSKYHLSSMLLNLSQKVVKDLDIIEISKPYLRELNDLSEEVVHLVMFERDEAVYIDKMEAKSNIRMYSYIGKRIPLYSSAVGKAYLAFSDHDSRQRYLETIDHIEPFTDFTLSKEGLVSELGDISKRGYAIDMEENELGVICVAAPIYDHRGQILYAISVSTPKFRLDDDKLKAYGQAVVQATNKISQVLGYL